MTAGQMADRFPLTRSTPSSHSNGRKHARLLVQKRRGTSIVCSLNVSALEQALTGLLELLRTGGDGKEASP